MSHWRNSGDSRPETAVRIENDGNPQTVADPNWLPSVLLRASANPLLNVYTPGMTEYPSVSILGAITGKLLATYFESDAISIQLTSATLPGVTIAYNSISKAVTDNSISKIFAGWYFRKAVEDGDQQGRQIADYAYENYFTEDEE